MSDLPKSQAFQVLAQSKFCAGQLNWTDKGNHVGILLATAQPEDETGAFIPGLTLQLEVKRPIVVDRCQYELGLFLLERGVRRRVYQLNVTPLNKRSHNFASNPIYGPHEHVGDSVEAVADPNVQCDHLELAFQFFCRRINLTFTGQLNSPL
jgi:hypothetical protein